MSSDNHSDHQETHRAERAQAFRTRAINTIEGYFRSGENGLVPVSLQFTENGKLFIRCMAISEEDGARGGLQVLAELSEFLSEAGIGHQAFERKVDLSGNRAVDCIGLGIEKGDGRVNSP